MEIMESPKSQEDFKQDDLTSLDANEAYTAPKFSSQVFQTTYCLNDTKENIEKSSMATDIDLGKFLLEPIELSQQY